MTGLKKNRNSICTAYPAACRNGLQTARELIHQRLLTSKVSCENAITGKFEIDPIPGYLAPELASRYSQNRIHRFRFMVDQVALRSRNGGFRTQPGYVTHYGETTGGAESFRMSRVD